MDAERYRRATEHDIEIHTWYANGTVRVNGDRGIDYLVDRHRATCTCPDWQKHRTVDGFKCKHLIKVELDADEAGPMVTVTSSTSQSDSSTGGSATSNYPADWGVRRIAAFKRDDWTCQSCGIEGGTKTSRELHAHHITPLADGGSDDLENLLTLCKRCHRRLHGQVTTTEVPPPTGPRPAPTETTGLTADAAPLAQDRADSPADQIYIPPGQHDVDDTAGVTTDETDTAGRTSEAGREAKRRVAEPVAGGDSDSETADAGLGVQLLAGLLLTVPIWLLLEGFFFLIGWGLGEPGTRFVAIYVPMALLCLGAEADEED